MLKLLKIRKLKQAEAVCKADVSTQGVKQIQRIWLES